MYHLGSEHHYLYYVMTTYKSEARLRIVAEDGSAGIWIWVHQNPKPGLALFYHITCYRVSSHL